MIHRLSFATASSAVQGPLPSSHGSLDREPWEWEAFIEDHGERFDAADLREHRDMTVGEARVFGDEVGGDLVVRRVS